MITKLLCKYLDRDGKGYVTMGNLITAASGLGTLLIIVMSYVRGATTIMGYWDGNIPTTLAAALNDAGYIDVICIPVALVGTGLILAIILSFALTLSWIIFCDVWTTKIVKCERKDGDEHEKVTCERKDEES